MRSIFDNPEWHFIDLSYWVGVALKCRCDSDVTTLADKLGQVSGTGWDLFMQNWALEIRNNNVRITSPAEHAADITEYFNTWSWEETSLSPDEEALYTSLRIVFRMFEAHDWEGALSFVFYE